VGRHLLDFGRWSLILSLISIPFSKPPTSIFLFFAAICALFGERLQERFHNACRQPLVIGCTVWFLVLLASALHAPAGTERWIGLEIYRALFYPLIVAMLFETQAWRVKGLMAWGLSTSVVLAISWAQLFWRVVHPGLPIATGSYTVFKNYTQQGIMFLALAALATSLAYSESIRKRRIMLLLVAGAAFVNVCFLLQSRTAYLIAVPLLIYWLWRVIGPRDMGWRGIAAASGILILTGAAAALSPLVQQRLVQAKFDVLAYTGEQKPTSIGVRLELWKRTLPMIASAPLVGHGLGQWRPQYQSKIIDETRSEEFLMRYPPQEATLILLDPKYLEPLLMLGHPHQEALLIISEEGLLGFAIFVVLLVLLWRHIRKLEPPYRDFYLCLLLIYVMAGLMNCVLADFTHRHVFLMLLACLPFAPATAGERKRT
jgi:O-antigen ligase